MALFTCFSMPGKQIVPKTFAFQMTSVFVCVSALALTSEAYFGALSKIGKNAFHTMSSHSLGTCEHIHASLLSGNSKRSLLFV